MKILFFQKPSGKRPVEQFLVKLSIEERARIAGCFASIEKLGFDTPRVQFRQIRGTLWEIKLKTSATSYRFFYVCLSQKTIVLLHAYKKQSQKAPKKEIETAMNRMLEVYRHESFYT